MLDGDPAPPSQKEAQQPPLSDPCFGPPKKGAQRIKMRLGTKVGLGLGHIMLDGDQLSPKKGAHTPQFSAHIHDGQTVAHLSYC